MKIDVPQYVVVTCTDNNNTSEALIIKDSAAQIRVELNGIPMTFRRYKAGIYVCSMHGLEFVIKR